MVWRTALHYDTIDSSCLAPLVLACSLLTLGCPPSGGTPSTTPESPSVAPPAATSPDDPAAAPSSGTASELAQANAAEPPPLTEPKDAPATGVVSQPEVAPEPNANLLVFETSVVLDLVPPAAPTDGTRFVPLADKLPLAPLAKQLGIRGGMHPLGRDPVRKFLRPLPPGFEREHRLRTTGWWFPAPDASILVIPHFRSNRGQSVEAALLARPTPEGFVAVPIGGEKTASNSDCASTLVMNEAQTEVGWYREMAYVDEYGGAIESLETMTCQVRAVAGSLEMVCTERDEQGNVRTRGASPPGTRP